MGRLSVLFCLLALLSCLAASQLSVKVTGTQDTILPQTNVSIMSNGVVIQTAKTGQDGIARFNLTDGSYFVILPRTTIYPPYVSLIHTRGNTQVTVTKYLCGGACTANAFGQITGPPSFNGTVVTAYSNGMIARRAHPNQDGFYMLQYVPEGSYTLAFESPGFETQSIEVFLAASDFVQADAGLKKIVQPTLPKDGLSAPLEAQLGGTIAVSLFVGGKTVAGEEVSVQTPSGSLVVKTDSQGVARVNGAEPGAYVFIYKEMSAKTTIASPKPQGQEEPPASLPAQEQPNVKEKTKDSSSPALAATATIAAGAFVIIILAALAFKSTRDSKGEKSHGEGKHHKKGHRG